MQKGQVKNLNMCSSCNGVIKDRNWCCGAKRVTVKSEDTKWKDFWRVIQEK